MMDKMPKVLQSSGEGGTYGPAESAKDPLGIFDSLLYLLQDSRWHTEQEIKEKLCLADGKLAPVLSFFDEFDFVSRRDELRMVKITPSGLGLLDLYAE